MAGLVHEVLNAYGGAQRWQSASTIAARGHIAGLLPTRFPGNKLADFTIRVRVTEPHVTLSNFPLDHQQGVLDRGEVRIQTSDGVGLDARADPRSYFAGLRGVRRNVRWDPLDLTYFAGYAFWNYLTAPLLLAHPEVTVTEGEPLTAPGRQRWRRLDAAFPSGLDTHCRHQTFYIDPAGLIRRHDFTAEPVGSWARASRHCDRHHQFDGLTIPARHRVYPRGPGERVLRRPTLLALDFDEIAIEY